MLELKKQGKLNYVGAEVLFKQDDSAMASEAYIQEMHEKGLICWVNAIVYSYRAVLSGGHNDDVSVSQDPDSGWGWLLKKGYDVIQTDWPLALSLYMKRSGK